jgi:triacylglycerol lipase
MGDMQISTQYVAYNLHQISSLAGGMKTWIITHSQGGPLTQWALRFWPSTNTIVNGLISLSPDFAGIELFDSKLSKICVGKLCQASLWQQSAGSNLLAALHADNFGAIVPTTAIWSKVDGVVNPPQENAQLPGAAVMSVQDLCPGRFTTHPQMTVDAAGYALAMDALKHGGKASVSRTRSDIFSTIGTCLRITAPKMNVDVANSVADALDDLIDGFMLVSRNAHSFAFANFEVVLAGLESQRSRQSWRTRSTQHSDHNLFMHLRTT